MPHAPEPTRGWLSGLISRPQPERRRWERTRWTASLTVGSAGCAYRASARDRSTGGVGAIVCGDLQLGEAVVLTMGQRKLRGVVRSRNGSRYGFEFVD